VFGESHSPDAKFTIYKGATVYQQELLVVISEAQLHIYFYL